VYPETARRMRTQGTVVVEVVLDETGKVVSANATSGPPMLRDAAVLAALKARFSPTKLSGQPVKVAGVINYKFALAP
ncbi:MAG TPA: energy transducer TonB, partial [Pyrinomonadaceae bacterium]|nr:energy transducer TonB [Pyrinomonadaceae bacterium]